MKNGERITEVIQKLRTIDDQWESYILDSESRKGEEVIDLVNQLFGVVRQELKTEKEEQVRARLLDGGVKSEAVNKFLAETQQSLRFYKNASFLRELENTDELSLKGLLLTIYQKWIVRYEPGYLERLAEQKYNEKNFIDMLSQ